MKKVLFLTVALMLSLAMGACALTVSGPNEFPIVDEPYELDVWMSLDATIEDMETNETTKYYEEKTGVHINWTQVSGDLATKLNLSISSGEYPDIYTCSFSTDQVTQYSQAGIFLPLNDLIEEHSYYIKQVLEERPDIKEAITAPDGQIYTLFKTDPATYTLVRNKLYVNHDWLEKYCQETGKEAPVTTQEFEDMLIYWRDNDMNGNGDPSDEIPMMGTLDNDFTIYLLNPFQATPTSDNVIADEAGNVQMVAITDEYREGLKWINHLYEEGLIAEETFIQDNSQLQSLVNKNDPEERTVGAFGGFWQGVTVSPASMENAYEIYDPLPPLEGPTGLRQATTSGHLNLYLEGAITTACERPDIAIKWLDWWFSNEGMVLIDYGFEGVNWEWSDTPAINGTVPSRMFLKDRNILQNTVWYVDTVPYYRTEESLFGRTPTDHVPYLYEGADMYDDFYTLTNFPQFAWCSDTNLLAEYNEMNTLFNDYIEQARVQFITGAMDIEDDAAWQGYLDQLNAMGLERYLEVVEEVNFGSAE